MFISILLASRISNVHTVIFFLLFAVICFVLFPELARGSKLNNALEFYLLCLLLYFSSTLLLYYLSHTLLIVYQIIVVSIVLICPLLLRYMQRYKKPLRGPWDVAPVTI